MNDTMHYIPAKPPLHYRILRWSTALNTPHHTIALIHSHTDVQIAFIHTLTCTLHSFTHWRADCIHSHIAHAHAGLGYYWMGDCSQVHHLSV